MQHRQKVVIGDIINTDLDRNDANAPNLCDPLQLETIRRTGSFHAAAKELKMSYRAIWMRIRTSEESIGKPLVVREGNGSRLTEYAERLMTRFENLQASILRHADEGYRDLLSDHLTCSGDR